MVSKLLYYTSRSQKKDKPMFSRFSTEPPFLIGFGAEVDMLNVPIQ